MTIASLPPTDQHFVFAVYGSASEDALRRLQARYRNTGQSPLILIWTPGQQGHAVAHIARTLSERNACTVFIDLRDAPGPTIEGALPCSDYGLCALANGTVLLLKDGRASPVELPPIARTPKARGEWIAPFDPSSRAIR